MNVITQIIRSFKPINYLLTLIIGLFILQVVCSVFSEQSHATEPVGTSFVFAENDDVQQDEIKRTMGIKASDCKKCHPSEVAQWEKTVHFQSPDIRLYKFEGNTAKYAKAMGVSNAEMLTSSMCADCHATKAVRGGEVKVISGVSCESCHGAAGGEKGWLNRHQSYHASMPATRQQETAEHRIARQKFCDDAGMNRSSNLFGLSKACFNCHIVGNEKLIAAGHKSASEFEFVSWSSGEVKHNFLVDKTKNEDAPSLWKERTGGTLKNRQRTKFVVGTMAQLERVLQIRANTTSKKFARKLKGMARDATDILEEINDAVETDEVTVAMEIVDDLKLTSLKKDDKQNYTAAAAKVKEQAMLFTKNHDGSQFGDLDETIKEFPAHFSVQYKEKYQGK